MAKSPLDTQPLAGGISERGRVRAQNEDAYALPAGLIKASDSSGRGYSYQLPTPPLPGWLFLVADGVGGSERGEVASDMAVRRVADAYYQAEANAQTRPVARLQQAIASANADIHGLAERTSASTATTLVALLWIGAKAFIANAGDSRAYRIRQGVITQLTQDHSWVDAQVRSGEMSPEDAATSDERHRITRCLGREATLVADIFESDIQPDDRFVLCTDGLTRHVPDNEILSVVRKHQDPQQAARALAGLANKRGGQDNITVIVTRAAGARPAQATAGPRGRNVRVPWRLLAWMIGLLLLLAVAFVGLGWARDRLVETVVRDAIATLDSQQSATQQAMPAATVVPPPGAQPPMGTATAIPVPAATPQAPPASVTPVACAPTGGPLSPVNADLAWWTAASLVDAPGVRAYG